MQKDLILQFQTIRKTTEQICSPLMVEDYVIQSLEDVSPPKWHLAHTTWFFETFLLKPNLINYRVFDPLYHHLFNSYYQRLGDPYPRIKRGLLARPTVQQVYDYRHYVDKYMIRLMQDKSSVDIDVNTLLQLGLHHEQQHQELLLMDIKHNYSLSPDFPAYAPSALSQTNEIVGDLKFTEIAGGITEIGHSLDDKNFSFDNERPRHQFILKPYAIANRLITNGEFADFIAEDGYKNPVWWLADGWNYVCNNEWQAPLYWLKKDDEWFIYTLNGLTVMDPNEPVTHLSYYEAFAYAAYVNKRLPTEAEWENIAAKQFPRAGNFFESNNYHPRPLQSAKNSIQQLFGDVWEWTSSPYVPYPGFKSDLTALGEYNGKFMSNQMVLRGGSCVTPQTHIRASYRNFFQPDKRWQFSGLRLAYDL